MAVQPLVNLGEIDLDRLEFRAEEIRKVNPQSYEMAQLDGVVKVDADAGIVVGYKNVKADEFWVRGHIPGRPLLPGVLIIEAAAQLCSFYFTTVRKSRRFLGFAGVDAVKFRAPVVPGDRLILVAKCVELRSRRATFETQGFVKDKLVFEGRIIGMPM